MARLIGKELPQDVFELLKPGDIGSKRNRVVQMITVSPDGWADAGMLSYADIIARDPRTLRLATWADGECALDLKANGRLTALVIGPDMAYYVKGRAVEVKPAGADVTDINQEGGESPLAFFEVEVEHVSEDRVPTARVLGGVTFEGSEVEDQAHREILRRLIQG